MIRFRNDYRVRERRRFPRVAANFDVRMIDVQLSRIDSLPKETPCYETHFVVTDAMGRDISEGGFAFESQAEPSVCSIFGLEFTVPQEESQASETNGSSSREDKAFRAVGQVVWTTRLEKKCLVGIRFIDQNSPRSAALRRLVGEHESPNHSVGFVRGGTMNSLEES
jgi:hypothetical protein